MIGAAIVLVGSRYRLVLGTNADLCEPCNCLQISPISLFAASLLVHRGEGCGGLVRPTGKRSYVTRPSDGATAHFRLTKFHVERNTPCLNQPYWVSLLPPPAVGDDVEAAGAAAGAAVENGAAAVGDAAADAGKAVGNAADKAAAETDELGNKAENAAAKIEADAHNESVSEAKKD
jgi:hypothetical protein